MIIVLCRYYIFINIYIKYTQYHLQYPYPVVFQITAFNNGILIKDGSNSLAYNDLLIDI